MGTLRDSEKASTREQPPRTVINRAIELAIMTLRVWQAVVVRGAPIVVRCASARE